MSTVALALSENVPVFELAAPMAVFGSPAPSGVAEWYDLTAHGPVGARVGGFLRLADAQSWEGLARADTVVVPACHDEALRPPADLVEAVRSAYDAGARVMAICTGAFVLAEAGLLDGRRAATHWQAAALLRRRFPQVHVDADVLYVDEGRVLTSAGKSAGMDLVLHVVRRDHGAAVANRLARLLVTPPHRDGGQAQYVDRAVAEVSAPRLGPLLDWAQEHLDEVASVADLARRAHVTTRTLNRRFHAELGEGPLRWLTRQRVGRAQQLLETSDETVEAIAHACGFGTTEAFRRHFLRAVRTLPSDYRRMFRAQQRGA